MEQCNACKCNKSCNNEYKKECKMDCKLDCKLDCNKSCENRSACYTEKTPCQQMKNRTAYYKEEKRCYPKYNCPETANDEIGCMPLAMSYVPWQQWGDVFTAECGLEHATIFPELVKPFWVNCGQ
ncbi:MAG: spore coat associated protein CotJA [bacterium]|nr:spore coat associated protein CotJA [bacterium]